MALESLNEAETRHQLIDPALRKRGWTNDLIKLEKTVGQIARLDGGNVGHMPGRIDYVLRAQLNPTSAAVTIALIEAKAEHLPPAHGLEQARRYARRLNVPFVYASNGHLFVEYEQKTGLTSAARPISEFPTPDELRHRYEQAVGFEFEDPSAAPLSIKYPPTGGTPRYYQDAAIRAALEKLARGDNRVLLTLATGAGKTFIAAQLLHKLSTAGQLTRALFVCDRDELRTQALTALQTVFGTNAAAASTGEPQKNARVVVATYQTLGIDKEDGTASFLSQHYPPGYFSHIIIDECHRSAWSKWRTVLDRNADGVHIGLTATPRRLVVPPSDADSDDVKQDLSILADNVRYFGEPVYEYTLGQAMEDGYLAACEIHQETVSLDPNGLTRDEVLEKAPTVVQTGVAADPDDVRQHYSRSQFEANLLLPDRVAAMCENLFQHLLATGGPHQKTIIFCARDTHAVAVTAAMGNLYSAWCQANGETLRPNYAFTCTGSSGGRDNIADFKGNQERYYIATSVELLSTGVDVPAVRNIVFFVYLASPIRFSQMVGRGTRIDAPTHKYLFHLYDYTNATRLFGDDKPQPPRKPSKPSEGPTGPPPPVLEVKGFAVSIATAGHLMLTNTLDDNAQPIPLEAYRAQLREGLVKLAPDPAALRAAWVIPDARQQLLLALPFGLGATKVVQHIDELDDCDLYDVLARLGYGQPARTRYDREALFTLTQSPWLSSLPSDTAATLRQVVRLFGDGGIEALESPQLFNAPAVYNAGGLRALQRAGKPAELLIQTKDRLLAA